jgi:hypothetical protein
MSARYVYWLRPDGRRDKDSKQEFARIELLKAWISATTVSVDKKLSWTGFDFERLQTALQLSLTVLTPEHDELNQTDARRIIVGALVECAKSRTSVTPITSKEFLEVADTQAAEFYRAPLSGYYLVSCISTRSLPNFVAEYFGCTIEPIASRSDFPFSSSLNHLGLKHTWEKTCYQWVKIRAFGRSKAEAGDRALRALSLLRAIWTFSSSYGQWTIRFGSESRPISSIHTGGIHTLHGLDGFPLEDFWTETDGRSESNLFCPSGGWGELERCRSVVTTLLLKHAAKTEIEQLFLRYISALDHTNHDLALLELWSLLEKISGTLGAKYDETIERASWIAKKPTEYRQLLDCVRVQRNRYVHSARNAEQADQAAYLIKSLVEPHLRLVLENSFGISSIAEYSEILSLPRNSEIIETRFRQLEIARKWHSPKPLSAEPAKGI